MPERCIAISAAAVTQLVRSLEKSPQSGAFVFAQIENFRDGFGVDRVWIDVLGERRLYPGNP